MEKGGENERVNARVKEIKKKSLGITLDYSIKTGNRDSSTFTY